MAKAKAVGGGIGAFFNNPGTIILGALAIGLLFFQKDIREAFGSLGSSLGEGFGNIDINLPEFNFPEIKFPDFNFPDFKFPDFNLDFGGFDFGDPFKGIQEGIDTIIDQFTNPLDPGRDPGTTTEEDIDVIPDTTGGLAERRRNQEQAAAERALAEAGPIGGSEILQAENELIFRARQDPIMDIVRNVQTGIQDQTFGGGGVLPSLAGL